MRTRCRTTVMVLLLCALAALPIRAEQPEFTMSRLAWSGVPHQTAHLVEVFNPFGDIRLRPSEADDIAASAVVQELVPDQPEAVLDVVEQPGRTRITVVLREGPENLDEYPGRVDLVVLLPTHVDVSARTLAGTIYTKSLRGRVAARSNTGDIVAIFKKLSRKAGNGLTSSIVLETETGNIQAVFLLDTDLRIHAQTAGAIQTQIPNDLLEGVRQSNGTLQGNLGSAENPVTIRSAFGTIDLRIPNAREQKTEDGGE